MLRTCMAHSWMKHRAYMSRSEIHNFGLIKDGFDLGVLHSDFSYKCFLADSCSELLC